MHILVIEDEQSLNLYLQDSLKNEGYTVSSITTFDDLNAYLENKNHPEPQVIIQDRLLHGVDCADKIPALKVKYPHSRILVLSAIGGTSEKSRILDSGADDYVSKPFSIEELCARIRVSQRYNLKVNQNIQTYGNLTINLLNQSAEVDGKRLELSRKEYQLLTTLLHSPTRVFNRYQLLENIWDAHTDVESNVVEVTIKNLRKKIEQIGASIQILSKRNVGYWIEV